MIKESFLNGITLQQFADAIKPLLQKTSTELVSENEFLTREGVCRLLSFNKTTLWKHTKSGKLKSYGIGNRVYYMRNEVLAAVKPINH